MTASHPTDRGRHIAALRNRARRPDPKAKANRSRANVKRAAVRDSHDS